jgi:DNA-binding transcriptional LysR family regulator
MMRDFNDLQFFAAVVLNRGFSAAARALKVPKSRISRRVALLEERLGVRLLDRGTRALGLTQVGQQVFEHARAAMIEAQAAEDAALRMQAEPCGLVRLSCPLGLQSAIAESLPRFLAAHSQLRVQCIATNRRVDLIHEGVDVAIRVRERLDTDADLQVKRIGVSRRILVACPDLLATAGVPTSPADLANFPILHQEEQGSGI